MPMLRLLTLFILSSFLALSQAKNPSPSIEMDFFLSSTCIHCHKAEAFLAEKAAAMPWLKIKKYAVNKDKSALEYFSQRLIAANSDNFTLPAFFFCGVHWVGFDNAEQSGKALMEALQYCHAHPDQVATKKILQEKADARLSSSHNWRYFSPFFLIMMLIIICYIYLRK